MTEASSDLPGRINVRMVIGIFSAVAVLWLATPFVMAVFVETLAEKGLAGDLYGSINALFSGLAFAGVIVAILLQREELALQRQELTLTRRELQRSADAQNASQEALSQTLFAQTFKMAIDILEEPRIVTARQVIAMHGHTYDTSNRRYNGVAVQESAEIVSRTFETIGALVRKALLPSKYITDTWSIPIVRSWQLLERFNQDLRTDRQDQYLARDFEYLADLAKAHLQETGQRLTG